MHEKRVAGLSYEGLRKSFRWRVPDAYNIGVDCCDRQASGAIALAHLTTEGKARIYTFGDLKVLSNRLANALAASGVERSDRVGIVVPQRSETAITHLAVYKLGAVAVPLSALFGPDALRFRLSNSGAKAVVVDADGVEKIEAIAGDLPDLIKIVVVDPITSDSQRIANFWEMLEGASQEYAPSL